MEKRDEDYPFDDLSELRINSSKRGQNCKIEEYFDDEYQDDYSKHIYSEKRN
jgi:hypothetical protein